MEMSFLNNVKTFLPIIMFNIVLPLIDIVTDLRLIIRLFSGFPICISYEDGIKVSESEWNNCNSTDDLSTYCHLHSNVCKFETHTIFATLLLGA